MSAGPVPPRRTATAVVALALLVQSILALAGPSQPAGAQGCGPAPSGQVAVVMVVDRGSGSPSSRCVTVRHGATGLDALRAAGHEVRLDGGFVCAIDGLPTTGCGNRPDAGFAYWRYWHAPASGGSWSYSQVGAGGYRLPTRCAVEGWVWSDSSSSDTPPRISAPTVTCEAPVTTAAPTTVPPTTSPSGTTPPPTTSSGVGSSGGGSTSGGNSTGTGSGSESAPDAGAGGSTSTSPADVAAETTVADQPSGTGAPGASGAEAPGDDGSSGGDDARVEGESARAADGSGGRAGIPWGVLVAVVLIGALGGAAVVVRTRRQQEGA